MLVNRLAAFLIVLSLALPALATPRTDALNALQWREIGPWRGGRVTAVTGVPGQPMRYYMGATGGGLWTSNNGGTSWENLSDGHFRVGTIGAIAVAPSDPQVLYVGTGEAPIRGVTTSHGDGMWKSVDGGRNWTHIGLEQAGQIARIEVHPDDADTLWVAVQGQIWGPSEQRGVFKSTDGGRNWRHVLKVNADTGATDLSLDPTNPRILYAALWHHGRKPWFIKSGGEGGGLYKSSDGGENWQQLSAGLPDLIGKAGIDVAASNPARVYAIIEAPDKEGGLYRSEDYGQTWRQVNQRRVLHTRPWYYNHITVDPTNDNTVWVLNVPLMKSIDGGHSFERVYTPHGDHHDHWINPDNPLNMINGNDGGATVTFDGGETWSSIMNQPTAQFYRVVTDDLDPFHIYGGQQDNTTVAIASASDYGGIGPEDYFPVGGGESAHIAFDPDNPRLIYATTINNTLTEFDRETGAYRSIMPYPEHVYGMFARDLKYRANWNAPVIVSPHDPAVIYYGTQYLLKSTDRGMNWAEISPDLTRNEADKQGLNGGPITAENVGAEYYNTIFAIVESPHAEGEIWVGADDGLLHLSRDGGQNWENVTPAGAAEGMVNSIEISPHDPDTVYFPLARYKLNDFRPYIYRSTNKGRSWQRIDKGLPGDTFVRVVREDPARRGLLYAGTEAGLFVSYDAGKNWISMQNSLPPVPITDLAIRHDKLVAATQGRGFWVLDDLGLLRQMDQDFADDDLHLFQPAGQRLGRNGSSGGDHEGANPPAGLVLSYHLKQAATEPVFIEILDDQGELVRRYSSAEGAHERCRLANMDLRSPFEIDYPGTDAGLNQWTWDLRQQPLKCIDNARIYAGFDGPTAIPGRYQARISTGENSQAANFELLPDPTSLADAGQTRAWATAMGELAALFNTIAVAIDDTRRARAAIEALPHTYPGDAALAELAGAAGSALSAWEASVTQLNFDTYEDEDSWPTLIDGQVRALLGIVDRSGPPISPGALQRKADLERQWAGHRQQLERILDGQVRAVNARARDGNLEQVPPVRLP